jgi:hypothetical protein
MPFQAPGWVEWDVTAQISGLYVHGDNGLYLRDAGADSTGGMTASFCSRENTVALCASAGGQPQLVVRFS